MKIKHYENPINKKAQNPNTEPQFHSLRATEISSSNSKQIPMKNVQQTMLSEGKFHFLFRCAGETLYLLTGSAMTRGQERQTSPTTIT